MLSPMLVTLIFAVPLLLACYTDFDRMKIPNWVSLAMAAGFFLTLPLTWAGLPTFGEHLTIGAIFFCAGFAMFAFGWLGGGDAKLMAAIALWLDWGSVANFIIYTTLVGAALGIALILSRKFMPMFLQSNALVTKLHQGGKDMPYAFALAAGGFAIWPSTAIFAGL